MIRQSAPLSFAGDGKPSLVTDANCAAFAKVCRSVLREKEAFGCRCAGVDEGGVLQWLRGIASETWTRQHCDTAVLKNTPSTNSKVVLKFDGRPSRGPTAGVSH